ncbi:MAG TPA: hypothetical protein VK524_07345, partial [Polyangiaceae bacterium]|nr:hypothetical protein [Polyangiaceae bacterium]
MKRFKTWWVLGFGLAVIAAGFVLYFVAGTRASDPSAYRVDFARGVYRYKLSYRTKQQGNIFSMPQGSGSASSTA